MKKKLLILGVVLLALTAIFALNVSAYEITSAEIAITPSKTEVNPGDTVEFTVSLKNLEADTGLMGLGAYVEYDSNLLELKNETEGLSGWTDATISPSTNRFATTRNSHSAKSEDILKITFTAKDVDSDKGTTIALKQVELSNGSELDIESVVSETITVKPKTATPTPEDPPENPPSDPSTNTVTNTTKEPSSNTVTNNSVDNTAKKPTNNTVSNTASNTATNTSKNTVNNTAKRPTNNTTKLPGGNTNNNDSESDTKIPNLGVKGYLSILIGIAVAVTILLYIKMKTLDKKIEKESQIFSEKNDEDKK